MLLRLAGRAAAAQGGCVAALLIAVLAATLARCGGQAQGGGRQDDLAAPPAVASPPPAGVTLPAPGRSDDLSGPFSIDTHLVVDQDVTLMTRMSGTVEEIFADRGSRVKKGDPLLRLMNRDLVLQHERAGIVAKQRQADFERARQLFAEKTISPSQFEAAENALDAARVDVEIAREELEKSYVRAPFDGLIIDRFARVGQKVTEDNNEPLFRLTTLSPILARLYLPEEIARTVRQGDKVEVRLRHLTGVSTMGRVSWISRVIDASSGTSLAIVSVPGGGKPGFEPGAAVTVILRPMGDEQEAVNQRQP